MGGAILKSDGEPAIVALQEQSEKNQDRVVQFFREETVSQMEQQRTQ